ncbi:MAG: SpoIIE family protein phosphatase [Cyclobacteriaceae bacterium]|nr:SpoIIE family protein phosphatase [Cyclobacteriaceae bacterium]
MTETFVDLLPQVFLTMFILSTLFYYRYLITKAESINFMELLWRVFLTGLGTTVVSLLLRLIFNLFSQTGFIKNPVTVNFFYHLYVGLVIVYVISTFVVWKRLILYQKTKNLIQLWNFFEYALYLALIFDFMGHKLQSLMFNVALVFLSTFSVVLSFNLKWIAYLNFRQKWKSILFILLSGIYLYHFFLNLTTYSSTGLLTNDLLDHVFVGAILLFIFIYALIAVLVTLFNLPTSSVFEQKLKEAVDFQKLSQSVPAGQSEMETYEILIDSSMSAVFADAAWIEVAQSDGNKLITRNIDAAEVALLKETSPNENIHRIINLRFTAGLNQQKNFSSLSKGTFRSIFALPILVKNEQIASLVLLQEVSDAFNREMVNIITTFVNQASITLENARLLDDAIENERYKEQLKIAKTVQKSLLPQQLSNNASFDIMAFSMAADEVGGDYYDMIDHGQGRHGLIIGDVSGKGTSAAFNMAQMKGIFHSLSQPGIEPAEFMIKANDALSRCLEKSSFITASYFEIDTTEKLVRYVRAGHCPAIIYQEKNQVILDFQTKGMGLGIVRNSEYEKYVHSNAFHYSPGDIFLLYTDGITEATNPDNQQFGDERLKTALLKYTCLQPEKIKEGIISELYAFLAGKKLEDDYTIVILKFN